MDIHDSQRINILLTSVNPSFPREKEDIFCFMLCVLTTLKCIAKVWYTQELHPPQDELWCLWCLSHFSFVSDAKLIFPNSFNCACVQCELANVVELAHQVNKLNSTFLTSVCHCEHGSILILVFSSKQHCALVQPHRAVKMADSEILLQAVQWSSL